MTYCKSLEKEDIQIAVSDRFVKTENVTKIRIFISGCKFGNESEQRIYDILCRANDFERDRIASDLCVAYCNTKGMEWGTICNIRCLNRQYGDEGHWVIEAIIEDKKYSA